MTRASSRWSEFRAQGGLWVAGQFALMAGIAAAWLLPPEWPDSVRQSLNILGIALALLGLGLAIWAYRSLGGSFTTYTTPPRGGERVEVGPYRLVRHPMYGGGILLFAGISLAYSISALVLSAALAALWRAKSAVEERELVARFPGYEEYRLRTSRRFLPFLY
ncbi:MAG: isoprenylcysteine carboxylmethyltransferase family protein [Actinobacteria bacterium]|nr:isoprenylcysteine carboxylmethyltransferase family protein [Actinomycetota bacterium]